MFGHSFGPSGGAAPETPSSTTDAPLAAPPDFTDVVKIIAITEEGTATVSLSISGTGVDGETLEIGPKIYTIVDEITDVDQILIGANAAGFASNIRDQFDADAGSLPFTATSPIATTIVCTANDPGAAGNDIPLDIASGHISASPPWNGGADYSEVISQTTLGELKNTLLQKRVREEVTGTTITPNRLDTEVTYQFNTQVAGVLTIANAIVGSPRDGDAWLLKIKSSNVQTFAWDTDYDGGTLALPTATSGAGLTDYYSFIYDGEGLKWRYTGTAGGF